MVMLWQKYYHHLNNNIKINDNIGQELTINPLVI